MMVAGKAVQEGSHKVGTQAVGIQGNLLEEVVPLDSTGEVGGHCSPPVGVEAGCSPPGGEEAGCSPPGGEEVGCTHKGGHHIRYMCLGVGHHCNMAAVVVDLVMVEEHHCSRVVLGVEGWLPEAVVVDCLTVP